MKQYPRITRWVGQLRKPTPSSLPKRLTPHIHHARTTAEEADGEAVAHLVGELAAGEGLP